MPTTTQRGRKPKLTAEVADRVVAAIRAGATQEAAAEAAGVGRSTFFRWLQEAENPDARPALRDFRDRVIEARAGVETELVAAIMADVRGGTYVETRTRRVEGRQTETTSVVRQIPPNGKLALEFLSRTRPESYRRQVALTGPDANQVAFQVDLSGVAERLAGLQAEREEDERLLAAVE